jgi:exosortase
VIQTLSQIGPTDQRAPEHAAHPRNRWLLAGGALLVAWGFLWDKLRIDWTVNDQYKYGWFVPPLALALLALRWRDRPPPRPVARFDPQLTALAGGCLFLLWPTRLIEEPNGDWRLIFWLHAGLLVGLSLALAACSGGWPWVRHFAFPTLFLLLAVRWPSGPEQAIVQGLMRGVAGVAAEGMNLLGIPAARQGNLIRIREQVVGVNEACSGIRSIQTVLMAGLLLGELSRLTWQRRLLLLGGGMAVALAANVFRSGLLVWITARQGAAALEKYHDAAGISVLLIVFAALLWLNGRLERGNPALKPLPDDDAPAARSAARLAPKGFLIGAAVWLLFVEVSTAGWYRWHERHRVRLPSWTVALPADAPGFKALPIDDVTRSLLRYDEGLSAQWRRPGPPEVGCTLFFFRWAPGRTSATLATMHQPSVCLPSSGLTQTLDAGIKPFATPAGITLPVDVYEFDLRGRRLYVYYVVWQDQSGYELPKEQAERADRLRAVWKGQRNLGQQTLEVVLTGPADAREAAAAFERELAAVIRPKG